MRSPRPPALLKKTQPRLLCSQGTIGVSGQGSSARAFRRPRTSRICRQVNAPSPNSNTPHNTSFRNGFLSPIPTQPHRHPGRRQRNRPQNRKILPVIRHQRVAHEINVRESPGRAAASPQNIPTRTTIPCPTAADNASTPAAPPPPAVPAHTTAHSPRQSATADKRISSSPAAPPCKDKTIPPNPPPPAATRNCPPAPPSAPMARWY